MMPHSSWVVLPPQIFQRYWPNVRVQGLQAMEARFYSAVRNDDGLYPLAGRFAVLSLTRA
jgi:hypothetical protein